MIINVEVVKQINRRSAYNAKGAHSVNSVHCVVVERVLKSNKTNTSILMDATMGMW